MATEPMAAVGVDVMDIGRRPLEGNMRTSAQYISSFRRQLTTMEYRSLMEVEDEEERYHAFYRIWVMKEAFVKALGTGLGLQLGRVGCVPVPSCSGSSGSCSDHCEWCIEVDGSLWPEWTLRFSSLSQRYLWCTITGPSRPEVGHHFISE